MPIEEGKAAPAFKLKDQDGNVVSLADFKGEQNVVLYFYPKDDTPGCTKEACGFRDFNKELQKLGTAVLGVSADGGESHRKFIGKYKLNFPLLSDYDHKAANAYGTWDDQKGGIIRSSFLIDENGMIVDVQYNVKPEDTVPKAKDALQTAGKER